MVLHRLLSGIATSVLALSSPGHAGASSKNFFSARDGDALLQKDRKFIAYAEKEMDRVREDILNGAVAGTREHVKQAQIYIGIISGEYMKSAEGVRLGREIEALSKRVALLAAGSGAIGPDERAALREKVDYPAALKEHENVIRLLLAGKTGRAGGRAYTIDDLLRLGKELPEFQAYEKSFRLRFWNLAVRFPEYGVLCCEERITVGGLLDLFKHAREYEADFTELVGETEIDRMIAKTDAAIQSLKQGGVLDAAMLDKFYGKEKSSRYFDLYIRFKPYYDKAGRALPMVRLNDLADKRTRLIRLVKSSKKNPDDSDLSGSLEGD